MRADDRYRHQLSKFAVQFIVAALGALALGFVLAELTH
jgi:hypothetical protein